MDEDVGEDPVVSACRGFLSVSGPLQSVQRAEFWDVILALQANDGIHLVVDNLGVVRHVGRLLGGRTAELVKDGDILFCLSRGCSVKGARPRRLLMWTLMGHRCGLTMRGTLGGSRSLAGKCH